MKRLFLLLPFLVLLLACPAAADIEEQSYVIEAPSATTIPEAEPLPTPEPTPAPSPIPEPVVTPEPGPLAGLVIGLDPGHQLVYDPHQEPVAPGSSQKKARVAGGARGVRSGVMEYEVNLAVGLKLRDKLEALGAEVVMTHEVLDVNISNAERAQIFNEHGVDLGIRLHCENSSKKNARGAFMIVPKESRTSYYEENVSAAKDILAAYLETTGLPMLYAKYEGLTYRADQAGFNWCTRPVICIEMGCLSHKEDDALLSDDAFQDLMAEGLAKGIVNHFYK